MLSILFHIPELMDTHYWLVLIWLASESVCHPTQPVLLPPGHGWLWQPWDSNFLSYMANTFSFLDVNSVCWTAISQTWSFCWFASLFALKNECIKHCVPYWHHFKEVLHLPVLVSVQYSDLFSVLILGCFNEPMFWMSGHT